MKDGAPESTPIPVPMIIEDSGFGERSYDIYSRRKFCGISIAITGSRPAKPRITG
jgi:hypothetical protein